MMSPLKRHTFASVELLEQRLALSSTPFSTTVVVEGQDSVAFAGYDSGYLASLDDDSRELNGNALESYFGDLSDPAVVPPEVSLENFGDTISLSAGGLWGNTPDSQYGPGGGGFSESTADQYTVFGNSGINTEIATLVGVFHSANGPDPDIVPEPLGTGDDMTNPELGQTFAIGDSLDNVRVPEGATVLYLGFNDAYHWTNNSGTVEVTVIDACPHPDILKFELGENYSVIRFEDTPMQQGVIEIQLAVGDRFTEFEVPFSDVSDEVTIDNDEILEFLSPTISESISSDYTIGAWVKGASEEPTNANGVMCNESVIFGFGTEDRDSFQFSGGRTTLNDNEYQCPEVPNLVFLGFEGDDNILIDGAVDATVVGGDGDDAIWGGGGNDFLVGGDGDDDIFGRDGQDTIRGAGGDDQIDGGRGKDILLGGAGNDTVRGENGSDVLVGGLGADDLDGGKGRDLVTGDDVVESQTPSDEFVIDFNSPADSIFDDLFPDVIDGGKGCDILVDPETKDAPLDSIADDLCDQGGTFVRF